MKKVLLLLSLLCAMTNSVVAQQFFNACSAGIDGILRIF